MKRILSLMSIMVLSPVLGQSYAPEAGVAGSTAMEPNSPLFVAWATGVTVERGYVNKANPGLVVSGSNRASAGVPQNALGPANGSVVCLGDEGSAILTFELPIINGPGFDFAVFENGGPSFLELGFVEVSSDGIHFFRFPAHSQTQTATQIGTFGTPSAPYLNNLAGKYGSKGVPFDLTDIPDNELLDKNKITHIKVIDVVGSIDPLYATYDSYGNAVNDSFPTPFNSGGFDLDAVGVIHQVTLGIGDTAKKKMMLYPNPASEKFYIQNLKETARITIYDLSGRIVFENNIQEAEAIPVSRLNSGIYIVEISTGTKKVNERLVVK
ncbi:T9SS type A sorting domain-containing protein [Flavobacterium lindanitolerans]|uniref:T9SS type A sorting domain-containing protein n=1 Tax=Flavobacterium lindanitolerans TaxID=428988 RepID=UPI0031D04008